MISSTRSLICGAPRAIGRDERLACRRSRVLCMRSGSMPHCDEPVAHRLRARFGQRLVARRVARRLHVHGQAHAHDLAVRAQRRADLAEHVVARRAIFATPRELDRLEQLEAIGAQHDERVARVGAAVVIVVAVDRLGLVRALVARVGDAVAVVVGIGAAVGVLEAVLVLGRRRDTCPARRGCRRRRCRFSGQPSSSWKPSLSSGRAGTCPCRRRCRRRRCRDRDSRRRRRTCPCPRARSGHASSLSLMPSSSLSFGGSGGRGGWIGLSSVALGRVREQQHAAVRPTCRRPT